MSETIGAQRGAETNPAREWVTYEPENDTHRLQMQKILKSFLSDPSMEPFLPLSPKVPSAIRRFVDMRSFIKSTDDRTLQALVLPSADSTKFLGVLFYQFGSGTMGGGGLYLDPSVRSGTLRALKDLTRIFLKKVDTFNERLSRFDRVSEIAFLRSSDKQLTNLYKRYGGTDISVEGRTDIVETKISLEALHRFAEPH